MQKLRGKDPNSGEEGPEFRRGEDWHVTREVTCLANKKKTKPSKIQKQKETRIWDRRRLAWPTRSCFEVIMATCTSRVILPTIRGLKCFPRKRLLCHHFYIYNVCVCVCVCPGACMRLCMCVCMCVFMCVCVCACACICVCACECLCMYVSSSACPRVRARVWHTYTHTHTQAHAHKHLSGKTNYQKGKTHYQNKKNDRPATQKCWMCAKNKPQNKLVRKKQTHSKKQVNLSGRNVFSHGCSHVTTRPSWQKFLKIFIYSWNK